MKSEIERESGGVWLGVCVVEVLVFLNQRLLILVEQALALASPILFIVDFSFSFRSDNFKGLMSLEC